MNVQQPSNGITGPNTPIVLQVTGCTAGDAELYNAVERSIECSIASQGPNVGPLGQSLLLAEAASQPPLSCMLNLARSPCDEIPEDRRRAAYNAFTSVTRLQPVQLDTFFSQVTEEQRQVLNFNAFYIYFPLFVVIIIGLWLMVGFNWISWPVGLFLSVLMFIILYAFSILYRIQVYNVLSNQDSIWQTNATNIQSNLANSVAYLPQGLFAASCAVTGDDSWSCNQGLEQGSNQWLKQSLNQESQTLTTSEKKRKRCRCDK